MLTEQEIEDIADITLSSSMGRGDLLTLAREIEQAATSPLEARIKELEAKLAEAQKDAARYRWLRDGPYSLRLAHKVFNTPSGNTEAVIDAAMEAKP